MSAVECSEARDPVAAESRRTRAQSAQGLGNLLATALDAAAFFPPLYVSSVLGHPWTWRPPHPYHSEFRVLDVWRLRRALTYAINVSIPSIPRTPPPLGPPLLNHFFWRPTVILQRPDHHGSYTSFPDEAWFFVNGIMTNDAVAQINAACLADLFHRPVTLVQNTTSSWAADLLECALGKEWHRTTEAAVKAFPAIYDALTNPAKTRVVVIAHSQGTIIMAVVLRMLAGITRATRTVAIADARASRFAEPEFVYPSDEPLDLSDFEPITEEQLAKLELYCFANCATSMPFFRPPGPGTAPIPWIESFGNEYDLVARLGMLAPRAAERRIEIAGSRYLHPRAWGHLLNQHYLIPIETDQRHGRRRGGRGGAAPFVLLDGSSWPGTSAPRLFSYINGGSPADA